MAKKVKRLLAGMLALVMLGSLLPEQAGGRAYASNGGIITTVAGAGGADYAGDGEQATSAQLNVPTGVAVDGDGNLYIADFFNNVIRKVDKLTGEISTVAGNGNIGDSGDTGPATDAELNFPQAVAVDGEGNLYIADTNNQRIRKVAPSGIIDTIAGTGTFGFSGDAAAATDAQLNYPQGIAVDGDGNVYIADSGNNRVRKIDKTTGNISTVAGDGTTAELNGPTGVAVDGDGNVYIADSGNNRIRKIDKLTEIVTTVAGTGNSVGDGGLATDAQLNYPAGVAVDNGGNVYIADSGDNRIRKVDPSGIIGTVAGTGTAGYSGDTGAAKDAQLFMPNGVAVDGSGNLYIADTHNNRIRRVTAVDPNTAAPDAPVIQMTVAEDGQITLSWQGSEGADSYSVYQGTEPHTYGASPVGTVTGTTYSYTATGLTNGITYYFAVKATNTGGSSGYSNEASAIPAVMYAITYDGNGNTGGSVPVDGHPYRHGASATVAGNTGGMTSNTGKIFVGWNTQADGNGIQYAPGSALTVGASDVTLYAQWRLVVISTIAGTGTAGYSGDGGVATSAQLSPMGVTADGNGNLYIADIQHNVIRKVDGGTWTISTITGTGTAGYSGDGGAAGSAQLRFPFDMTADGNGNLYIADSGNNVIRKVDLSTGKIATFAGTGASGYEGDGEDAQSARLSFPTGVAVGSDGDVYIADSGNHVIRKVDGDTGKISTIAGTGTYGYNGDGAAATTAQLYSPSSVDVDNGGNVYIADSNNNRIRKVDGATGDISTVAGTGTAGYSGDGAEATTAELSAPRSVVVDGSGNVYITDMGNNRIRKVDAITGTISTIAGTGTAGYSGDGGAATSARLSLPADIALDADGNMIIADSSFFQGNYRVRKVASGQTVTYDGNGSSAGSVPIDGNLYTQGASATVPGNAGNLTRHGGTFFGWNTQADGSGTSYAPGSALTMGRTNVTLYAQWAITAIGTIAGTGTPGYSGDGGPATLAQVNYPAGLVVDGSGNVIFADTTRIRKVDSATGKISTIAGMGATGYSGDGEAATTAKLNQPAGVALDGSGNVYIADTNNHSIRKVDRATGKISTIAGTGTDGYSGDGGPATAALLDRPFGVAVDGSGNVYIADSYNNAIRKVDRATGKISTIAGTGTDGYSGDGGAATEARLNAPASVAVDGNGDLYIVDARSNVIRKVDHATGKISTIAGTGTAGYSGDGGAATSALLNAPYGVALDSGGNVYISETGNRVVRKVEKATGKISTIAGNGGMESSGDGGTARSAGLGLLLSIAVDSGGDVYTTHSSSVRKIARGYSVFYHGNGNTGGSIPTDKYLYLQGATVKVSGNAGSLAKTGYGFAGWNTKADGSGTVYAAGATLTIGAANMTLYAQWSPNPAAPSDNSGSSGSTGSSGNGGTSSSTVTKEVDLGTSSQSVVNGQSVTTIAIDGRKLQEQLDSQGQKAVITVQASDSSDVVNAALSGQMLKSMGDKQAILEVKTEQASYSLPADQIDTDSLSRQLGSSVNLSDIQIHVQIAKASEETVEIVQNKERQGEFQIIAPPVEFTVEAEYRNKKVYISQFSAYVTRTIAIPDGVDPGKVTTAVVVEPGGSTRQVPTTIIQIDGKYYAQIKSLTNSTYMVIYRQVSFEDVKSHWARDAVNNMGSRMIVNGIGNNLFAPDENITRGEFVAMMVRAMGLGASTGSAAFTDVLPSDWYHGAVETASAYRLISGFPDGAFRPMEKVTREQAMVILSAAMKWTGLMDTLSVSGTEETLQAFADASEVSDWAKIHVAIGVQAGMITGRSQTRLAPQALITRAEAAAILERLLHKSGLI